MVNTGVSLKVLDGKGNINFRLNDIFQGMKFAFNPSTPFVKMENLTRKAELLI